MRNVSKNVSSRPTNLFCRSCWNEPACTCFLGTNTQLFFGSLYSHTLCSCLNFFSTTNIIWNFWHSKFQPVSDDVFYSWDDIITPKWNCVSPTNSCNCTETAPTLSTNTSIEWNLYLSWSNHLVTTFRLEMNNGGFSKHQNKTSDTYRHRGYFFTTRVSQVNASTMKRIFQLWSELKVAKCLMVHVLSSS